MAFEGKGSWKRPKQITTKESDLRWELAFGKCTPERKEEILKLLEEITDQQVRK